MRDETSLERYGRAQRDEVLRFLRTVHVPDDAARIEAQWEWKYDRNPFNVESDPYILLLRRDDRLIGLMGAIFLPVWVEGRGHRVANAGDLVIHPDFRGRDLARLIIRRFEADNLMSMAWLNRISSRATGSVTSGRLVRMNSLVRPLDVSRILGAAGVRGPLVNRVFGAILSPLWRARRRRSASRIAVADAEPSDGRLDVLWRRVRTQYPVLIARDGAYLSWRYCDRPDAIYSLLVAEREGRVVGYLVFRKVTRFGLPWASIVDFLVGPRDRDVLGVLVDEALHRLAGAGLAGVSTLATSTSLRSVLFRRGFWPWPRSRSTFFASRAQLPDPDLAVFQLPSRWFLTMGDGDLEMGS